MAPCGEDAALDWIRSSSAGYNLRQIAQVAAVGGHLRRLGDSGMAVHWHPNAGYPPNLSSTGARRRPKPPQ